MAGPMNRLRAWADASPLRPLLLHPRVRHVGSRLLMARFLPALAEVREPVRFAAGSVAGRGVGCYRLRRSGLTLVVDHAAGPLELLEEIFRAGCYEPPAALAGRVPPQPRILDLGANVGAFAAWAVARWPDAEVTGIEADPANVRLARAFADLNGLDRVEVRHACAGVSDEPVEFLTGLGSGSRAGEGGEVVPGLDVLPLIAGSDLVKMDIEGGEWPILADPRLADAGPTVLVLEYHRVGAPGLPALDAAERLLGAAGFTTGYAEPNHWGHGLLWAWRDRPNGAE